MNKIKRHKNVKHQKKILEESRSTKRAKVVKNFSPVFLTCTLENKSRILTEATCTLKDPFWKKAMISEIDSIMQNHTWESVDLPLGCKPLGYKLIFKWKMKTDGTIDKYKPRIFVKSFKQS